jgi:hypothetical protein
MMRYPSSAVFFLFFFSGILLLEIGQQIAGISIMVSSMLVYVTIVVCFQIKDGYILSVLGKTFATRATYPAFFWLVITVEIAAIISFIRHLIAFIG